MKALILQQQLSTRPSPTIPQPTILTITPQIRSVNANELTPNPPRIPMVRTWREVINQWDHGDNERGLYLALSMWPKIWRRNEKQKYHQRKLIALEFMFHERNINNFESFYAGFLTPLKLLIKTIREKKLERGENYISDISESESFP